MRRACGTRRRYYKLCESRLRSTTRDALGTFGERTAVRWLLRGDDDYIHYRPQLCRGNDRNRECGDGQKLAARARLVVAGNPAQRGASWRSVACRCRLEWLDGSPQAVVSGSLRSPGGRTTWLPLGYIHVLLVAPLAARIGLSLAMDSPSTPQSAAHRNHHQFLQASV